MTGSNAATLDSLRRRMRAMISLYEDATSTMDLPHVNHREREGVLPIAFSLFHYVNMHDASFMLLTGEAPVCTDETMAAIAPAIPDHGKHRTVDEMQMQQIGDWRAFLDYMGAVFSRTEEWLARIEPAELDRVLMTRPFPPHIATTFSARVAGEAGMTVLDGVECWLYQHGLRHMGEIELARSFVGLGGMTS
jgi:hypothetical protein